MNNKFSKTYLHYGSQITLELQEQKSSFICGKGFILKNVFVENFIKSDQDYMNCVFLVMPTQEYEIQKQIMDKIRHRGSISNKELSQDDRLELLESMENELKQNADRFEKCKGLKITFGESFMLQHYVSKRFLSFQQNQDNTEIQKTFVLQLDKQPSDNTIFKFQFKYKYQLEQSSYVRFEDYVYLCCNSDKDGYVYYLTDQMQKEEMAQSLEQKEQGGDIDMQQSFQHYQGRRQGEEDLQQQSPLHGRKLGEQITQREVQKQLFVAFEKGKFFWLHLHQEYEEQDHCYIKYGHKVWMQSYEHQTYLECIDILQQLRIANHPLPSYIENYHDVEKYKFLDIKQKPESCDINTLSKVGSLAFRIQASKELNNSQAIWTIEGASVGLCGFIKIVEKVRIRNTLNGMYLGLQKMSDTGKPVAVLLSLNQILLQQQQQGSEIQDDILFSLEIQTRQRFGQNNTQQVSQQQQQQQKQQGQLLVSNQSPLLDIRRRSQAINDLGENSYEGGGLVFNQNNIMLAQYQQQANMENLGLTAEQAAAFNVKYSTQRYFSYNDFFRIRHCKTGLYLGQDINKGEQVAQVQEEKDGTLNIEQSSRMLYDKCPLQFKMQLDEVEYLSFTKCKANILWETQFLMESLSVLYDGIQIAENCHESLLKHVKAAVQQMNQLFPKDEGQVWNEQKQMQMGIDKSQKSVNEVLNYKHSSSDANLLSLNQKRYLETLCNSLVEIQQFCQEEYEFQTPQFDLNSTRNGIRVNLQRQNMLREKGVLRCVALILSKLLPVNSDVTNFILFGERFFQQQPNVQQNPILSYAQGQRQGQAPRKQSSGPISLFAYFSVTRGDIEKIIALIKKLGQSCYSLIKIICENNLTNQEQCAKYFSIFKEHIGMGIGTEQCLQSIVQANEYLQYNITCIDVQTFRDEEEDITFDNMMRLFSASGSNASRTLSRLAVAPRFFAELSIQTLPHFFIARMKQFKQFMDIIKFTSIEMIEFLNSIMQYDNAGMTLNQMLIMQLLFDKDRSQHQTLFSIESEMEQKDKQGKKKIYVRLDDFRKELQEFMNNQDQCLIQILQQQQQLNSEQMLGIQKEQSLDQALLNRYNEQTEKKPLKEFLQRQLMLYGNICLMRNYNCNELITKVLPFSHINEYLWQDQLDEDIRASLVYIVNTAYLDMRPQEQRRVPSLVYIIDLKSNANNQQNTPHTNMETVNNNINDRSGLNEQLLNKEGGKQGQQRKSMEGDEMNILGGIIGNMDNKKKDKQQNVSFISTDIENLIKKISDHLQKLCQRNTESFTSFLTLNMINLVKNLLLFDCFHFRPVSHGSVEGVNGNRGQLQSQQSLSILSEENYQSERSQETAQIFKSLGQLLKINKVDKKMQEKRKSIQKKTLIQRKVDQLQKREAALSSKSENRSDAISNLIFSQSLLRQLCHSYMESTRLNHQTQDRLQRASMIKTQIIEIFIIYLQQRREMFVKKIVGFINERLQQEDIQKHGAISLGGGGSGGVEINMIFQNQGERRQLEEAIKKTIIDNLDNLLPSLTLPSPDSEDKGGLLQWLQNQFPNLLDQLKNFWPYKYIKRLLIKRPKKKRRQQQSKSGVRSRSDSQGNSGADGRQRSGTLTRQNSSSVSGAGTNMQMQGNQISSSSNFGDEENFIQQQFQSQIEGKEIQTIEYYFNQVDQAILSQQQQTMESRVTNKKQNGKGDDNDDGASDNEDQGEKELKIRTGGVQPLLYQLLETFQTNNDYKMNVLNLKLIFQNYQQTKIVLKDLKNIQLLSNPKEMQIYKILEGLARKFNYQCEKSEMWLFAQDKLKQGTQEALQQQKMMYKTLNIIRSLNDIYFQSTNLLNKMVWNYKVSHYNNSVMKDSEHGGGSGISEIMQMQGHSGMIEEETGDIKMNRQFMMKNLDVHLSVISLLKEAQHLIKDIIIVNEDDKIVKIVRECFKFLRYFCINDNKINKKLLYNHINFLIKFINYVELGQADCISEIYHDNYKAITEVTEDIIRAFVDKIVVNKSLRQLNSKLLAQKNQLQKKVSQQQLQQQQKQQNLKSQSQLSPPSFQQQQITSTEIKCQHHTRYLKFINNILFFKKTYIHINIRKVLNVFLDLTHLEEEDESSQLNTKNTNLNMEASGYLGTQGQLQSSKQVNTHSHKQGAGFNIDKEVPPLQELLFMKRSWQLDDVRIVKNTTSSGDKQPIPIDNSASQLPLQQQVNPSAGGVGGGGTLITSPQQKQSIHENKSMIGRYVFDFSCGINHSNNQNQAFMEEDCSINNNQPQQSQIQSKHQPHMKAVQYIAQNEPYIYHQQILEIMLILLQKSKINTGQLSYRLRQCLRPYYLIYLIAKADCYSKEDPNQKEYLIFHMKQTLIKLFIRLYSSYDQITLWSNDLFEKDYTQKFISNQLSNLLKYCPNIDKKLLKSLNTKGTSIIQVIKGFSGMQQQQQQQQQQQPSFSALLGNKIGVSDGPGGAGSSRTSKKSKSSFRLKLLLLKIGKIDITNKMYYFYYFFQSVLPLLNLLFRVQQTMKDSQLPNSDQFENFKKDYDTLIKEALQNQELIVMLTKIPKLLASIHEAEKCFDTVFVIPQVSGSNKEDSIKENGMKQGSNLTKEIGQQTYHGPSPDQEGYDSLQKNKGGPSNDPLQQAQSQVPRQQRQATGGAFHTIESISLAEIHQMKLMPEMFKVQGYYSGENNNCDQAMHQHQHMNEDLEREVNLPIQNILSIKDIPSQHLAREQFCRSYVLNFLFMKEVKDRIDIERRAFIYEIKKLETLLSKDTGAQQARMSTAPNSLNDSMNPSGQGGGQRASQAVPNRRILRFDACMSKLVIFTKQVFVKYIQEGAKQDYSVLIEMLRFFIDFIEMSKSEEHKIKYQNLLNRLQLPRILLEIICFPDFQFDFQKNHTSLKIFRCIVLLMIALLDGGNDNVQGQCYDFFVASPHSEKFFELIKKIIEDEIAQQQEISIYDQIEEDLDTIDFVYRSRDKFVSITQVLRLIQLFSENHNQKLQMYLQCQTNSHNSYNIINIIARLLEALIKDASQEAQLKITLSKLDKINQCFDTLIEMVQGPCKINQIELADSKFLDVVKSVLRGDDRLDQNDTQQATADAANNTLQQLQHQKQLTKSNRQWRKYSTNENARASARARAQKQKMQNNRFRNSLKQKIVEYLEMLSPSFSDKVKKKFNESEEFQKWMLSRLKYKCMISIESILEGNDDYSILRKVIKAIPVQNLQENIGYIYEKFKTYFALNGKEEEAYDIDLFNNADLDVEDIYTNQHNEAHRAELIIETGFKIFQLLHKYQELEKYNLLLEEEQEDDPMIKKKGLLSMEILQDNLIADLSKAGIGILKIIFQIADKLIQKSKKILQVGLNSQKTTIDQDKERQKKIKGEVQQELQDLIPMGQKFFEKYSVHIEIQFQGNKYEIYFPKLPYCFQLTELAKEHFELGVDRTSTNSKLKGLLSKANEYILEMKHEKEMIKVYKKTFILKIINQEFETWRNLAFYNSFLVNILILTMLEGNHQLEMKPSSASTMSQGNGQFSIPKNQFVNQKAIQDVLYYAQFSQIILAFFVCIFYLVKQFRLLIAISQSEAEISMKRVQHFDTIKRIFLQILLQAYTYFRIVILNKEILYYSGYFVFSVLAFFNPVFCAVLLLEVFYRYPLLSAILESLYRPREAIFLTLLLFILFTYFFTLFFYFSYYDDYSPVCESLLRCFFVILDSTYKYTAGFLASDALLDTSIYMEDWSFNSRVIYDFFYIFIVITLILEIISGIIIDTFKQLRDESEDKERDRKNVCFICGNSLEELERQAGGFKHHINNVHQKWNYFFYIAYLRDKQSTEYTGFESYVKGQIDNFDTGWFPIKSTQSELESQKGQEQAIDEENKLQPEERMKLHMLQRMERFNERIDLIEQQVKTLLSKKDQDHNREQHQFNYY